jgi:hypothetical protein
MLMALSSMYSDALGRVPLIEKVRLVFSAMKEAALALRGEHRSRQQLLQLQRLPAVQRQIRHAAGVHRFIDRRRVGIDVVDVGRDLRGFLGVTHLQDEVDTGALVDFDDHARAHGALEGGRFGADAVLAGPYVGNDVIATFVSDGRIVGLSVGQCGDYPGVRDQSAG